MELIFVRHAEPVQVTVAGGGADPVLSALGRAQADALAACPALGNIDAIVQSPAQRAVQTARPLAERLGLAPLTDPDLLEWDWGSEDYTPVEEMRAKNDPRWQSMIRGEAYPGVDVPAFRGRVRDAVERVAVAHPGRTRVLVVCHAGVINSFIGEVIGAQALVWFHPAYTSFSRIAVARDGRRGILSLNETPHLLALAKATHA